MMSETSMLSKCANPVCTTPFHYLRDGKLFQGHSLSPADVIQCGSESPGVEGRHHEVHLIEYLARGCPRLRRLTGYSQWTQPV
jgi:hypothetical protein